MAEEAPAAAPAKAPAKAPKKKSAPRAKKDGPSLPKLIVAAVADSKERKGMSLAALKKVLAGKGLAKKEPKAPKPAKKVVKKKAPVKAKKPAAKKGPPLPRKPLLRNRSAKKTPKKSPAKKAVKKVVKKSPKKSPPLRSQRLPRSLQPRKREPRSPQRRRPRSKQQLQPALSAPKALFRANTPSPKDMIPKMHHCF
ncbi:hypothetical protein CRENBAI_024264 [Crenichthys baileyi]|uniref:H15 domain-containing protein n=1 Tax=Crenichthys baileyi TaxID=28760 RepID=A0AAV9QSX7_9TELE